jgi:hypothetical protein
MALRPPTTLYFQKEALVSNRHLSRRALALRWLIALVLLLPATAAAAQGVAPEQATQPDTTASVSLVRASPNVQGCALTTVDVWVNNVVAAYGVDVRINYDPTKLMVIDQDQYSYGTQIQPLSGFMKPDFVMRQVACNALDPADPFCDEAAEVGTIWYAFTQVNPTQEVSGSGAIARITFRAVGAGLSPLDFFYSKMSDRNGITIPNTETDSELTAAPLADPVVTIGKLNATTARLSWSGVASAATYRIFRATAPYFTPAEPAFGFTSGFSYEDSNALGSTAQEYFYIVKSACADGYTSAGSNRTGAWDYDLVPGS